MKEWACRGDAETNQGSQDHTSSKVRTGEGLRGPGATTEVTREGSGGGSGRPLS